MPEPGSDWSRKTSEFVTSSITSGGDGYDKADGQHPWAPWNPNLTFWTNLRGYVSTTITPSEMTVDYRCVRYVTQPGSPVFTRAQYVVEDGVRDAGGVPTREPGGLGGDVLGAEADALTRIARQDAGACERGLVVPLGEQVAVDGLCGRRLHR